MGLADLTLISVLAGLFAVGAAAAVGWRLGARRPARPSPPAARAEPLDPHLQSALQDIPYGMAVFDSQDRLIFCNELHRAIDSRAHQLMVPGETFEAIMRGAANLGCYAQDGEALESFIANRLAAHRDPQGKPLLLNLSNGRWIQIRERRTALGGTLTTWNDVTPQKLREGALAILAERSTKGHSHLETAAEALAAGLGCRVAGIAQHIGEARARLQVLWDGGLTGESYEYDLEGAPCGELTRGEDYYHVPDDILVRFPGHEFARQAGARSFIGHVIRGADGRVTGHIFALDDQPMGTEPWRRETLELIARWVEIAFDEQDARDIAEEHAQRWRDVADLAADWIWETGPDLRFTLVSERISQVLGIDAADLIGTRREERFVGNPSDSAWQNHLATLRARKPFRNFQYEFEAPDGAVRHVRISGTPVFDKHGAFKGYRGTGTDLTAEVTARAKSMETLDTLEAVFENIPDGISLTDETLNMVAINRRFLELLDFPPDRFQRGDPFEKFIRYNAERGEYGPGDPDEQVRARIELVKRSQPHRLVRTRPDGRILEIRGTPLPSGGFVTTYADVTEARRRERALAILVGQESQERSYLDMATEALMVGLGCRWVGVAEITSENRGRVLAMRDENGPVPAFEYDLRGTPCARVHESEYCFYPKGVSELFPDDEMLRDMKVEAFQGHMIRGIEGNVFGHVFALHDNAKHAESWTEDLIRLVARWLGMAFSQQQAEEALRENAERARDFAEAASDWQLEMDENLRFTYFSPSMEEKAGISPERLLGKTREEYLAEADPAMVEIIGEADWDSHLADLKAHRPFRNFVHARALNDGRVAYISLNGNPVFDSAGRFKGYRGSGSNITEQVYAEKALRDSQASLADAQRLARLGNWDWNIVTNQMSCSDEVYKILGLSREEAGTTHGVFMERVHPEDRDAVQAALERALSGAPYALDHRIVLPDGTDRIVHEQGEVQFDPDGKPHFMRGTVQDVTEQRQAVAALEDREQRIRAIMDSVGDAVVAGDAYGIIESVNRVTEKIFGYRPEELIGRNMSILMAEPHRSQHDSYLRRYRETKVPTVLGVKEREVLGQRKDGTPIDIELTISKTRRDGQDLFIGSMRDITERKRSQQAVRQKTAFIALSKAVAAAANEASTAQEALRTGVAEICRYTGWALGCAYLVSRHGPKALRPTPIWHHEGDDEHAALRDFVMATRFAPSESLPGRILATAKPEYLVKAPHKTYGPFANKVFEQGMEAMFGFPITMGAEAVGALVFFTNRADELDDATMEVMTHIGTQFGRVVERDRAQRSLLAAKEAAEYANRTKSEFLATMSHELRTPLNAIIGFSEIMTEEMFGPVGHGNYRNYAEDIHRSGIHLLKIINDILDVSKAEAGRITLTEEELNLADIVASALRLTKPHAQEKNIEIKSELPATPIVVTADELRLRQVLLNLLSNAVKFTNAGSVTIRAQADAASGLTMQIVDTGIGIAKRDLERIFEPFAQAESTLSRTYEGTGLGLPLSRKLIELHGGTLTVESTQGEGSAAVIWLPAERVRSEADVA